MVKSLDLANITALADSGAYGGNRSLSPTSAAIILCAALWMSELDNWQGAGSELTENEIDEIEEFVAELQYEVMTESEGAMGDLIKIAETVVTTDNAEVYVDDFLSGDYIAFKLIVQGMLSNYASNWPDHVEVEYNDIQSNGAYTSYGRFFYNGTPINYQNLLDYPANLLYWASAAAQQDSGIWGHFELTVFMPQIVGQKTYSSVSVQAGFTGTKISNTVGSGGIYIAQPLTKILVRPLYGTSFLAGGGGEPPEMRMTLYGMK